MIDPCTIIDSLNFNKEEDLIHILSRDKHTRIEGLFTEYFFHNEIIKDNFSDVSSGWWFSLKKGQYYISKILTSFDTLIDFDVELFNFFVEKNHAVFLIVFEEHEKKFYYIHYKSEYSLDLTNVFNELKKEYPKNQITACIPNENERNAQRIDQAIDYLKKNDILKKCSIERLFANCWLANGYFWDIDYIVKYNSKYIAFEVKQKFPTAANTWGLNVGLANLFSYLNSIDIEVVHVILVKPIKDDTIPAIDLYTKEEYKKDAKWIATEFDKIFLSNKSIAPAYTSIYGNSKLSYYNMKQELFTMIKEVNSNQNNIITFLNQ